MGDVVYLGKHRFEPVTNVFGEETGLLFCRVCHGAEASLPLCCPGYRMDSGTQDKVQAGEIDFTQKGWISLTSALTISLHDEVRLLSGGKIMKVEKIYDWGGQRAVVRDHNKLYDFSIGILRKVLK